ncbi:phage baseplate protein [Spartinivicinus ruber]|uniref:phage baseplate protein n=1 Tax=Spartinivicinus ruber TaxID=2683272 RepID=UPI0013D15615|nr:phage baseplate protein [Spartinivicinus ruber]
MIGIDRVTGKTITGETQLISRIQQVITTPIGGRLKRRAFGSRVPELMGQLQTPQNAMLAQMYILEALKNPANDVQDFTPKRCQVMAGEQGFIAVLTGQWEEKNTTLEVVIE